MVAADHKILLKLSWSLVLYRRAVFFYFKNTYMEMMLMLIMIASCTGKAA